jgi:antirestriction protein
MKQNAKIAKELIKLAKELVADYSEDDTPKVYVGTYAKYNNGDLTGEWVDLTNFSNKEDFLEYCAELHSDESDPEFMFQDYENFPREYYG